MGSGEKPVALRLSPRALGVAGGTLCLALTLLAPAVFQGRLLVRRDASMLWLPQVETFVRAIASGSFPLWDPYSSFGRPFLADPRAEVLYPPTWLNLVARPNVSFAVFAVGHLWLSALGLYLLARRLGASQSAAFAGGAVWICSGPLFSLVPQWHHLAGAAWLPWLAFTGDLALRSQRPRHVVLWAVTATFQVFAGSPDYSALGGLALVVVWTGRIAEQPQPDWWRAARTAAAAAVLLALLSAAQWLPTLEWAVRSGRQAQSAAAQTTWSLHPAALLEAPFPFHWDRLPLSPQAVKVILERREPWLQSIFLGPIALALVACGLSRARASRLALGAVLLVFTLDACGRHLPLHGWLVHAIPPLQLFRYPVKSMVIAAFAASLLAAFGFDRFLDAIAARRSSRCLPAVVVLLAVVVAGCGLAIAQHARVTEGLWGAATWGPAMEAGRRLGAHLLYASGLALAGLALLWLPTRRAARGPVSAALLVLAAAPALLFHLGLHLTAPRSFLDYRPEALDAIGARDQARVYVYDYSSGASLRVDTNPGVEHGTYVVARVPSGWTPAEALWLGAHMYLNPPTAARWGVAASFDTDVLDMDPPYLSRLKRFLREHENGPEHTRLLRAGGVTHVLALVPGTWTRELISLGTLPSLFEKPIHLYRVPGPLPRAYVVGRASVVADDADALARLSSPEFEPRAEVVLASGPATTTARDQVGTARLTERTANRLRVFVRLSKDGYLVVLDSFDPGWRARVDGRAAEVLRADVGFRAVRVPAGSHSVEMVYRPRGVVWGVALSGLGMVATGVLSVFGRRR